MMKVGQARRILEREKDVERHLRSLSGTAGVNFPFLTSLHVTPRQMVKERKCLNECGLISPT